MRWLTGAIVISVMIILVGRADAVGRTPGNMLQVLGWGSGAGYHAPIAHAHPPLRRGILHAPEEFWVGGSGFGPSRLQPGFPAAYPPYSPYVVPRAAPSHGWEVVPPGADGEILLPPADEVDEGLPPAPPEADGEPAPSADTAAAPGRDEG